VCDGAYQGTDGVRRETSLGVTTLGGILEEGYNGEQGWRLMTL